MNQQDAKDAARYRWWRLQWTANTDEAMDVLNDYLSGANDPAAVDVAIDAAIQEGV